MFRRTFWFSAGAAAGVWATTKVNRKLRSLAPESLAVRAADRAVIAGHRLREIAVDARSQMIQREHELNEALGLTPHPDGARRARELSARQRPPTLPGRDPRATSGPPHRSHGNEDH
ncbi:DUF6167 family protein [Streptomyces sp. TRM 70351]|uniref:DUF6167 family protein n=1 Tax=Streptomyces sp. TRM 70351 TaxID=3116552 RepID=UPI002E7BEC81|nr:DUF6167 family protein [Streptomyces sp. TRM 70351]MEE1929065.1 DUF6167 family protein [Streptomyces sp. TRM 70351]